MIKKLQEDTLLKKKTQKHFLFYIECFLFIMSYMYLAKTVTDLKWYVGMSFLFKAFKCMH